MIQYLNIELAPTDNVPIIFDWSAWVAPPYDPALAGDYIVTATASIAPANVAIGDTAIIGNTVRVWVGPGEIGVYVLSCTISTQAGVIATSERNLSILPDAR